MRLKRTMAGTTAILALLAWPARSLATLDGSNSGAYTSARFTGDDGGPAITSAPEHLDLTIFSSANETCTPPFGPWLDDFAYEAMVVGNGTVSYGSAAGKIETDAKAVPEVVEPGAGNPNGPTYNQDASTVDATIHLDFEEDGVVTGGASGTPVTVTVNFMIESTGVMVGGHPSFD